MQAIKYPMALLPAGVFLYFLDQGFAAVFGAHLPTLLCGSSMTENPGILLSLAVIGLLCVLFLTIVGLTFGNWLARAVARYGGLRCGLYLGETFSGARYYVEYPRAGKALMTFKTNDAGNPSAQSFRHLFRYHLLDDAGLRLEHKEIGLHHGVEQLIISLITLWLIFIFVGLAFLPSMIFEVLSAPRLPESGFFLPLQTIYADQVLLPSMPGLALAFAVTLALGLAALWRRHSLLVYYEETRPNATARPRVQSGEILDGRIIERSRIDPVWYHTPHVGYSLEIAGRFEPPVVLGFSLAARPDCPVYAGLERAAATDGKVRVWVDPHARIRPLSESLAEVGE